MLQTCSVGLLLKYIYRICEVQRVYGVRGFSRCFIFIHAPDSSSASVKSDSNSASVKSDSSSTSLKSVKIELVEKLPEAQDFFEVLTIHRMMLTVRRSCSEFQLSIQLMASAVLHEAQAFCELPNRYSCSRLELCINKVGLLLQCNPTRCLIVLYASDSSSSSPMRGFSSRCLLVINAPDTHSASVKLLTRL